MTQKIILAFIFLLPACLPGYAQRGRGGSANAEAISTSIVIERPSPGKDGFSVYAKYFINLSDGKETNGKWSQRYAINIKAGEYVHVAAAGEDFNIGLGTTAFILCELPPAT